MGDIGNQVGFLNLLTQVQFNSNDLGNRYIGDQVSCFATLL